MSQRLDDKFVARLPVELWRKTFRHATYVPRLLNPNWGGSPEPDEYAWSSVWPSDGVGVDPEKETRQTIVSVCREWREIGLEFMWEVVRLNEVQLRSVTTLKRLLVILTSSGHGRWIKRIDFIGSEAHISVHCLLSILESIQSLRIFHFAGRWATPEEITDISSTIVKRFSHSLRYLAFLAWPTKDTSSNVSASQHPQQTPPTLTLPLLTTLCLPSHHVITSQVGGPALRRVHIHGQLLSGDPGVSRWLSFLEVYGAQLTSLVIDALELFDGEIELGLILALTPHLESLTIEDLQNNWDCTDFLPKLTHLALFNGTDLCPMRLLQGIQNGNFPSLAVVRMLGLPNPVGGEYFLDYLRAIDISVERNIRLENSQGQLLEVDHLLMTP